MNYIVIIVIAIIILIGIGWIIVDRKRKTSLQAEIDNLDSVKNKFKVVDMYLEKLDDISTKEEMRTIYENYQKKRNHLDVLLRGYDQAVEELEEYNSVFKEKEFSKQLAEIKEKYSDLYYEVKDLASRAKRLSEVGDQNASYNLKLNSNLKSIQRQFDIELRPLEIYDESFNSVIVDVKNQLLHYQELQTQAHFTQARETLVKTDKMIQAITEVLTRLTVFYKALDEFDSIVGSIHLIIGEIDNQGYKLYINNFDGFMNEIKIREENTLSKMADVSFLNPDESLIKNISNDIEGLRKDLENMNSKIEEQYGYIKELMDIEEDNTVKISLMDDILTRSLDEVEAIKVRYNINDSTQMATLEKFRKTFDGFKKDHEKLIEIIHDAKENHKQLIDRAKKANLFLRKSLMSLKESVKELEGFRLEELQARELVDNLPKDRVEIDLYLRRNGHIDSLSSKLKKCLTDFDNDYEMLVHELQKEQIDIHQVATLSESLIANYKKLVSKEGGVDNLIEQDVQRRVGCYYLIQYISRINKSVARESVQGLYSNYNLNNYNDCLIGAKDVLNKIEPTKGDKIYRKIVDKVNVEAYMPILMDVDSTNIE